MGAHRSTEADEGRRLLVVSHPAIVSVNQLVYRELTRRGWTLTLIVPSRWRHAYSDAPVVPTALEGLEGALRPVRVMLPGRQQRHLYLARCRAIAARVRPDVCFIEAEPFSLAAGQWAFALSRLGLRFGVQCAENIDRALPLPLTTLRSYVLHRAAFVAARSESAARLARAWGAVGRVALAPHAVPGWDVLTDRDERPFTVGFAGRLIESKGIRDLLEATRRLKAPVEVTLIGNGDLREALDGAPIPGSRARVLDNVAHADMAAAYGRLDVLVLPSRTTATWKEQFGRVIVEALWCGVPVIGSNSGEIPWLIELTGGGRVFREGDIDQLTERLEELRGDPALRQELAQNGRDAVERLFSVPAATDALEHLLDQASRVKPTDPDGRDEQTAGHFRVG